MNKDVNHQILSGGQAVVESLRIEGVKICLWFNWFCYNGIIRCPL